MKMAFFPSGRINLIPDSNQWIREYGVTPVIWFESGSSDTVVPTIYSGCHLIPHSLAIDPSPGQLTYEGPSVSMVVLENFLDSDSYRILGPLAASEFDRFPRFSTFRSVDRDAICRRLAMYLLSVFSHKNPDFFLASETPHNAVGLATLAVCDYMDIPTLFFQPTSSVGPNMVPRIRVNQIFNSPVLGKKIKILNSSFPSLKDQRLQLMTKLIEGVSENKPPPRFVQQNPHLQETSSSPVSKVMSALGGTYSNRVAALRGLFGGRKVESVAMEAILRSYRKNFEVAANSLPREAPRLAPGPAALFALHYQPERTSIPEGPLEASQLVSIVRIRNFLPTEMTLYVKEHPSQISRARIGYLGRSVHFYEFLKDMPGVRVLSPESRLEELLSQVSTLFTLTGTLGIQATLAGIPAIYLGNPWWEGLPGSWKFDSLDTIDQVRDSKMPRPSEIVDFLSNRILVDSIPGFSTPSQQKSWTTVDPSLSESVLEHEGEFFKQVLGEFLEEFVSRP